MLVCFVRPSISTDTVRSTAEYEAPGPVNSEDFLPKSAFADKKLFVEKIAQNNGLQNTYRIKTDGMEYEITGNEAVLQFLLESRATNELRQISTAKAVKRGLSQSAKATYQTGKQIARDPIDAVKKVPQGVSRFFGKAKEFLNPDEDNPNQRASAGATIKGFLGVEDQKRKLAARLGVDVYSRNQALQKELDRVASALAAGGMAFDIGTLPIGGAVGIGLTAIGIDQSVDKLIKESSSDDLRKWNEQNLSELGANRELIVQFLNHPWYSPRQETTITAALKRIQVDVNLFLETANKALTDQDGSYFQRVAQLLAAYSEKIAPLQSFRLQDELLCAVDSHGVLVVPVSFDYAIWTATVSQRIKALASLAASDQHIKSVEIWTDGKLSERVKAELAKSAIGYQSLSLVEAK